MQMLPCFNPIHQFLKETIQTFSHKCKKVNAYIFDLDGTIIDSDTLWLNAWKHGLHRLGRRIKDREIVKYFGLSAPDVARLLLKEDFRNLNNLVNSVEKYFDATWKDLIKPMPGVADTLIYLNERGFGRAVASSSPKERIKMILKRFYLEKYFDVIVGRDDVEKGKPSPDLVIEAAKRLGLPSANCFYVGDSVYDVIAGKRAGSRTVLFINRPINMTSLDAEPDHIIYALYDLRRIVSKETP